MTIPAELDLYIECEMRERGIPGLALAISRNGEILTERAYGLASIQNDAPVTTGTRFAIASITKPITAIGIMLLVEDGKVELDAPVSRYLPEVPPEWSTITVRHLLNHTSGLPESGRGWAEWENQDREDLLRLGGLHWPTEPLYRLALQDTLWFAPGTDWVYSDVGYFLLGVITERASGMSWRDFIHERIFLPLGMTASYISDGWTIYPDEARGYAIREGVLANIRRDGSDETPSHYGIFSSVGDLAKLDAALHTDGLLNEASRHTMWAPTELSGGQSIPYGLGWEVWSMRGHWAQYHGGITGAEFLRMPDDSLAVIVLSNLGHGTRYGMSQNVAKLLIPELKRPSLREVPIPETELHRYVGHYEYISGDSIEVKLVDGRLVAPYPWPFPRQGGEAALIHQGNHVFEFVDHDGRIAFQPGEDGTVAGLSAVAWDGYYQSDYRRAAPTPPPSPQPEVDPSSHVPHERLPIIDMHMHVRPADHYGTPPMLLCAPPVNMPRWDPVEPIEVIFEPHPGEAPCPHPQWSAETDEEVFRQTIEIMERHNIYGVLGGQPEQVRAWTDAAPGRFIPALDFRLDRATGTATPGAAQAAESYRPLSPDSMRALYDEGVFEVLAEVLNAFGGIAPDDERMAPYWELAEDLDIPVGIHIGPGAPGEFYLGNQGFRARLQSALTMEEVLVRHPRLRVYIMHAGYPLLDDLRALLFSYPQVYVEVGILANLEPRPAFYRFLQGIVESGYGERVMFGSDGTVWPGLIEVAIDAISEAPFLTEDQKRDIFYNNAARFLRLSEEEMARHHHIEILHR